MHIGGDQGGWAFSKLSPPLTNLGGRADPPPRALVRLNKNNLIFLKTILFTSRPHCDRKLQKADRELAIGATEIIINFEKPLRGTQKKQGNKKDYASRKSAIVWRLKGILVQKVCTSF